MSTELAAHADDAAAVVERTESKLTELALDAGISDVRRLPIENSFNSVYEITP